MNRTDLISAVAERTELPRKDAEAAVSAVTEAIAAALREGEKVQLLGFGTFEVKDRAARAGRDPQTQEAIDIPAFKAVVFKAGKPLKDSIQ